SMTRIQVAYAARLGRFATATSAVPSRSSAEPVSVSIGSSGVGVASCGVFSMRALEHPRGRRYRLRLRLVHSLQILLRVDDDEVGQPGDAAPARRLLLGIILIRRDERAQIGHR